MQDVEVPLICDERQGLAILRLERRLTPEEIERVKREFLGQQNPQGAILILDKSVDFIPLHPYGWPDAEFCAA